MYRKTQLTAQHVALRENIVALAGALGGDLSAFSLRRRRRLSNDIDVATWENTTTPYEFLEEISASIRNDNYGLSQIKDDTIALKALDAVVVNLLENGTFGLGALKTGISATREQVGNSTHGLPGIASIVEDVQHLLNAIAYDLSGAYTLPSISSHLTNESYSLPNIWSYLTDPGHGLLTLKDALGSIANDSSSVLDILNNDAFGLQSIMQTLGGTVVPELEILLNEVNERNTNNTLQILEQISKENENFTANRTIETQMVIQQIGAVSQKVLAIELLLLNSSFGLSTIRAMIDDSRTGIESILENSSYGLSHIKEAADASSNTANEIKGLLENGDDILGVIKNKLVEITDDFLGDGEIGLATLSVALANANEGIVNASDELNSVSNLLESHGSSLESLESTLSAANQILVNNSNDLYKIEAHLTDPDHGLELIQSTLNHSEEQDDVLRANVVALAASLGGNLSAIGQSDNVTDVVTWEGSQTPYDLLAGLNATVESELFGLKRVKDALDLILSQLGTCDSGAMQALSLLHNDTFGLEALEESLTTINQGLFSSTIGLPNIQNHLTDADNILHSILSHLNSTEHGLEVLKNSGSSVMAILLALQDTLGGPDDSNNVAQVVDDIRSVLGTSSNNSTAFNLLEDVNDGVDQIQLALDTSVANHLAALQRQVNDLNTNNTIKILETISDESQNSTAETAVVVAAIGGVKMEVLELENALNDSTTGLPAANSKLLVIENKLTDAPYGLQHLYEGIRSSNERLGNTTGGLVKILDLLGPNTASDGDELTLFGVLREIQSGILGSDQSLGDLSVAVETLLGTPTNSSSTISKILEDVETSVGTFNDDTSVAGILADLLSTVGSKAQNDTSIVRRVENIQGFLETSVRADLLDGLNASSANIMGELKTTQLNIADSSSEMESKITSQTADIIGNMTNLESYLTEHIGATRSEIVGNLSTEASKIEGQISLGSTEILRNITATSSQLEQYMDEKAIEILSNYSAEMMQMGEKMTSMTGEIATMFSSEMSGMAENVTELFESCNVQSDNFGAQVELLIQDQTSEILDNVSTGSSQMQALIVSQIAQKSANILFRAGESEANLTSEIQVSKAAIMDELGDLAESEANLTSEIQACKATIMSELSDLTNAIEVDAKCVYSPGNNQAPGKTLTLEFMVYTTILGEDVNVTIDSPEIVYKGKDGTVRSINATSTSKTQLGPGRQHLSIAVETSNDAIRNMNDVLIVDFKVATTTSDKVQKKRVSVLPCGPPCGHS